MNEPDPPSRDNVPVGVTTDVLTGTTLRPHFIKKVDAHVQEAGIDNLHILTVEITRFGVVNGSVGPATADLILVKTAKRLMKLFPGAIAIGRMHGDHFSLALDDSSLESDVQRLLDFMQRPFAIDGEIIVLSVRIGAADIGCGADNALSLLHAAEVALHQTKSDLDKVTYFNASMVQSARETHTLENDLRLSLAMNAAELHKAINNFEFFVAYQPIIDLKTGTTHAMEALLRWRHPKKGLIPPEKFIHMAEDIRVMDVLGGWILRRACADAAFWPNNPDGSQPAVSINVSKIQFREPGILLNMLEEALDDTLLPPERIKIEITESLVDTPETRQAIEAIRELGCAIALDDFGSGYSSLTQLQGLPLDYLKVDQGFVKNIGADNHELSNEAEQLTRSVLALGEVMRLHTVVEGVETPRQLELVRAMGARYVQGYVFAMPMACEKVPEWINRYHKDAEEHS